MTVIFDGRAFAKEKEEELGSRVLLLKEKGITPKMVSIVIGDVDGALKYQEMKKKAGERVGVEVEITQVNQEIKLIKLNTLIKDLNTDPKIHGVMVQLPLPKNFTSDDREQILNAIDPKKDVDGMRGNSEFVAPVVRAVMEALQKSQISNPKSQTVAVVGAEGFAGKKMVRKLEDLGYRVQGIDKNSRSTIHDLRTTDIIISCTGKPSLITGNMIKESAVCIDVGAPKGDFDFESVRAKARFITPVPGGIGPMTIVLLMENIIKSATILGRK